MEPSTTLWKSETASFPPLQDPGKQIRLLRVESAEGFNDDVYCSLLQYSLKEAPSFSAISYTWGPEHPQRQIFINHIPFPVRENCHYAIQQARWYFGSEPALIWIDSVCIRQEALEEKSAQVQIMGEIYAQAVKILACIGPSDESSDFVAGVLKDVDQWVGDFPSEYGDGFEEQMAEVWESASHNDPKTAELRHHCACFCSRAYFHRVWIVQELFEGRGRTHILCGSTIMDLDCLADFIWRMDLIIDRGGFGDDEPPWNNFLRIYNQITATAKSTFLGDVLAMSKYLLCIDPRDRVFAVLRLVDWADSGLPSPVPDYNQSTFELALNLILDSHINHFADLLKLVEAFQLTCQNLDDGDYLFTPEHDDPKEWSVSIYGAHFTKANETGKFVIDHQAYPAKLYRSESINSNLPQLFKGESPTAIYRKDSISALASPDTKVGDIVVETKYFDFVVRPLDGIREYEVVGKSVPYERLAKGPRQLWTCQCAKIRTRQDHFHTIRLGFMATVRNMLSYAICVQAAKDGDDAAAIRKLSLEVPMAGSPLRDVTAETCAEDCIIKPMDKECDDHGDAVHREAARHGHLWFNAHVAGDSSILCTSRLWHIRQEGV